MLLAIATSLAVLSLSANAQCKYQVTLDIFALSANAQCKYQVTLDIFVKLH